VKGTIVGCRRVMCVVLALWLMIVPGVVEIVGIVFSLLHVQRLQLPNGFGNADGDDRVLNTHKREWQQPRIESD